MTKQKREEIRAAMNLLKELTASDWEEFHEEGADAKNKIIGDQTAFILRALGVKASNVGHQYLMDAISLVLKDRLDIQSIYQNLSAKYKVAEKLVEQSIKHSISEAYHEMRALNVWIEIFDNTISFEDENPPEDIHFIYEIANYLKVS